MCDWLTRLILSKDWQTEVCKTNFDCFFKANQQLLLISWFVLCDSSVEIKDQFKENVFVSSNENRVCKYSKVDLENPAISYETS